MPYHTMPCHDITLHYNTIHSTVQHNTIQYHTIHTLRMYIYIWINRYIKMKMMVPGILSMHHGFSHSLPVTVTLQPPFTRRPNLPWRSCSLCPEVPCCAGLLVQAAPQACCVRSDPDSSSREITSGGSLATDTTGEQLAKHRGEVKSLILPLVAIILMAWSKRNEKCDNGSRKSQWCPKLWEHCRSSTKAHRCEVLSDVPGS